MDARFGLILSLMGLSLSAGCCCDLCGDGCGRSCWPTFCRPYEERIAAENSQCGTCCREVGCGGGIKQWLHNKATHCKGCGDIYWGEWISDPPDCCDPCDQCGDFTGAGVCCDHGCGSGIFCRLGHFLRGHRYCPGPCGCDDCGGVGCDSCGYDGMIEGEVIPGHGSVLEENWDPSPAPRPTPGKTLHKAEAPQHLKVSGVPLAPSSGGRMAYVAPAPQHATW